MVCTELHRSVASKNHCIHVEDEDGTKMVDSVVSIPLSGRTLVSTAASNGAAPPCHFLVGSENSLVVTAVQSVLGKQCKNYNPLVFYGPSGTGKSHLAEGFAAAWRTCHRRQKVVCTTASDFARDLADAVEMQAVDEFRAKCRGAALLVIEDLGMLITGRSAKLSVQEELICTLDVMIAEGRLVIVTASAAPNLLHGIVPALQSRLQSGLTIPLALPSVETRLAILRELAACRDIPLSEPAARILAEGLSGTPPQLTGSLLQFAAVNSSKAPLSAAAAKKYVAGRRHSHQPSLHEIALATARHFSLRIVDVRSSVRKRPLVVARGVAVYLARSLTSESLEDIGRYFGGRDHTTILHSCQRTEQSAKKDPAISDAIETLAKKLGEAS
jgi:chromosomal replication initiator protein